MVHLASKKGQVADARFKFSTNEANITSFKNGLSLLARETRYNADIVIHFIDAISNEVVLLYETNVIFNTIHSTAKTLAAPTVDEFIRDQAKGAYCGTETR